MGDIMSKLYSLDTYRECIKDMPKTEALAGIILENQEDLDVHYKNIEIVKADKIKPYQSLFSYQDDIS